MKGYSMKKALLLFLTATVLAQTPATVMVPKDPNSIKDLQLALERQKSLNLQAQVMQSAYNQQITNLTQQYQAQDAIVATEEKAIREANHWEKDVTLNRATGQFEKAAPKPDGPSITPTVKK
jgi:hypothetical protein